MDGKDSTATRPLLSVRGLTKNFGGSSALAGVDLDVHAGEVHGLLGENGSGKSTLIKILAGYHDPDAGAVYVRGVRVALPFAAGEPRRLGFAFVHQDLALIPSLSVSENLFVEELAASRGIWVDWRGQRRRAADVCRSYGLEVDPTTKVADLEPVERALLAIIRAVHQVTGGAAKAVGDRLLVLDEPTVFLPQAQIDRLFELMRRIAAAGSGVLFVSHDLGEVIRVTDRITVLRDGRVAGTAVTRETDVADLIRLIVGRALPDTGGRPAADGSGDEFLRVEGMVTERLRDVSFSGRLGEVLGVTGLVGSGYEEVVYALFGARPALAGRLHLAGAVCDLSSLNPHRGMELGMALIPADRHGQGAILTLTLADNLTSVTLPQHFRRLLLRRREMYGRALALSETFDIRPPEPDLDYGALSGGNQQKAMLAKWLQLAPRILLLHEPTQGVDIGARHQILDLLRSARSERVVICASSDHEQLAGICDRVMVFGRGSIVAEIAGADLTSERITTECLKSTIGAELSSM